MRRALLIWCLLLAGIVCISQSERTSAFWQSRDSNYNISISTGGALACSYTPITSATYNVAYTGATPSASGGSPTYTFTQTGTLPTGFTISATTGVISGTDSVDSGGATYPGIQVKVTDLALNTANCGSSFTITVAAGGLLLDSLSATAISAFSTRKLRSAYAGSALNVTTSASGNATQDIGFVSNNLDTASLATFIGSNTGTVGKWYDQSPSGATAVQSTISQQPAIVSSGTNRTRNSNVCPFYASATNTEFTWTPPAQAQPFTTTFVSQTTATTSGHHFTDGSTPGGSGSVRVLIGNGNAGAHWSIYAGSTALFSSNATDTNMHAWFAVFNAASTVLYEDGSSIISGTSPGTNGYNGSGYYIGGSLTGTQTIDGYLCEFILFSSALSAGDQATLHSSWQSYWGTP